MLEADDAAEFLHPAQPFVTHIPEQSQSTARPEHPRDLGTRPISVEPVPRLCHQNGVDAVVRQRNLFGTAQQGRCVRKGCPQNVEQFCDRVDRHHVQSALDQAAGEFSGPGPEIEYVPRTVG